MTSDPAPTTRYATEVALRWGDMDAYRHVNNVQYHRLLEEARINAFDDWFDAVGTESMLSSGVILARQEIEFLTPITYRRAPVLIEVWVTRIGGASFDLAYEVADPGGVGDRVYARARGTLAAFDLQAERPRRIPDAERAALAEHLGPPVPMRAHR